MLRDPRVYLQDILDAVATIRRYTRGLDREGFRQDEMRRDAVIRNLEIIGEAVKQIPEPLKATVQDVEWRKIAGLRDVLIHQYFGLDADVLWDVVEDKLTALAAAVERILRDVDGERPSGR